ncbi:MAG: methylated-DNA--[protein]-cysteine S-methyltransferase [Epsilonproteobacteria bacterium]|nr:methylated-DNA--[protein]-cysteine S-methyltransferase [Campylobacterota bacterium]
MNHIHVKYHKTKYGELIAGSYGDKLCMLDWRYRRMRTTIDSRISNTLNADFVEQESDIIQETITQLDDYFAMERKVFDIPLLMVGTPFQKQVWEALIKVPYGTTSSYLQLAKEIENDKAVRAVASANGANAISILIPCHRIIGSNGDLTGYAGGLSVKKRLLSLEQNLLLV